MHVHLREPGQTAKETIATGTAAAARGGFTSRGLHAQHVAGHRQRRHGGADPGRKRAREGVVNVFVAGAITEGLAGEELAPIGSLKQAGVVAITDDGHCVQNNELMRRALEYARMFDLPVLDHCQDYSLVTDGVMHEGYWSTALGLRGWPAAGEELIVAPRHSDGGNHRCPRPLPAFEQRPAASPWCGTPENAGLPITAEACPHHFTLTDAAIAGSEDFWKEDGQQVYGARNPGFARPEWPRYDTNFKMNPPLGSAPDRQAILEGLADGTIEMLASDHAPHCDYEKEVEFDYAPFGITGLETDLALSLMQLYHSGLLSLPGVIEKYTAAPARLLRLPKGTLSPGADADVTVFDPDLEWSWTPSQTASKSKNSPFYGWPFKGKALATIVGGRIAWSGL